MTYDDSGTYPSALELDRDLDLVFADLGSAVERLIDIGDRGDLMALGPDRLIDAMRRFETHRSQLAAVDHAFVEAVEEERLVDRTCARSTAGALVEILRIGHGEAKTRVTASSKLRPRHGFSTGPVGAELPVLAAAQRDGTVTGEQTRVVITALREIAAHPELDDDQITRAEQLLVEHAATFAPRELQQIAGKLYDVLVPDGKAQRDTLARARRGVTVGPQRSDGTSTISGVLAAGLRAKLNAVLSPLAAPRPGGPDGADQRSAAQRTHDALEDVCERLLRSGTLPQSGGTPATVHVTVPFEDLMTLLSDWELSSTGNSSLTTGVRASDGTQLSVPDLLNIAAEAEVIPTYLNQAGGVIAYGCNRRVATAKQTQALIGRDGGCTFPSCTAQPDWCERHHVIAWIRGGPTDLDNLILVCGYHHREFLRNGWHVVMRDGAPSWIPPTWVDSRQQPIPHLRTRVKREGDNVERRLAVAAVRREPPEADARTAAGREAHELVDELAGLVTSSYTDGLRRLLMSAVDFYAACELAGIAAA